MCYYLINSLGVDRMKVVLGTVMVVTATGTALWLLWQKMPASIARYRAPEMISEQIKDESAGTLKVLQFLRATDPDYADQWQTAVCGDDARLLSNEEVITKTATVLGTSYSDSARAYSIIKDIYSKFECPTS